MCACPRIARRIFKRSLMPAAVIGRGLRLSGRPSLSKVAEYRQPSARHFLTRSHWDTLHACDFFSVEALGITGTVRYMVFFVIEIKSRAVKIAGIAIDPGEAWMKQVARNLTDPVDGFLRGAKYLIHDRDPLFTEAFVAILKAGGVKSVKIPAQSPNCNPHAERFVKTIKYECLNNFAIFGERHLRYLIKEFVEHFLSERFHQGIGGQLIKGEAGSANDNGAITRRSRLGGFLNYYHREVA